MRRFALLVALSLLAAIPASAHAKKASSTAAAGGGHKFLKKHSGGAPRETTKDGLPNVLAAAAVVVDLDSGEELFAKDPDAVRNIASVGKLLVALTVRAKQIPLDGKTTMLEDDKKWAHGGAKSHLLVGRTFTNHDLMRAMLISSDNRAVTAVGRGAGLDPDKLVAAVNEEAKALGLTKTEFTDPTGLHGNVSTPRELIIVLRAALADPVIAEILATPQTTIESVDSKHVKLDLWNTNRSLRGGKRTVLGGKTGYTDQARYCLAIAAKIGDKRIGMVFLGAEGKLTRFGDFSRAAEWIEAGGPEKARAAHVATITTTTGVPAAAPPGSAVGRSAELPPAAITPRLKLAN